METNRVMVRAEVSKPKVTKEHLLPILPFAKALTGIKPIRLIYADGKVVRAGGARVASWMTVDQSKTGLSFGISDEPLKLFIEKYINNDLPDSPRNSRFKMVDGQLQEIAPGLIGTVVDINDLKTQLVAFLHLQYSAFSSGSFNPAVDDAKEILVSFKQEYPKVTSDTIKRFHITDLIGRSETSFKGSSASRVKNISLGIERISGTILAPGDEFSLVKAIGEVTEETGYDKEYVIKGDRSIKEAGGGLCQVATTAFRGVLDAGLPVTERQNHSYVVGYYGPGLDATIYGPHPDLKFVNDTKDYMLFQMRVEGTKVITELYGKKDNRSVTTSAPILFDYIDPPPPKYIPDLEKAWGEMECHDQPRKGLTTQATTTVTYADGKVRTQVFDSVYQPWPKICIVGIKR
jgi:vancomycin resistance protein YoaR